MSNSSGLCRVIESVTGRYPRTVTLENDLLRISILADKGADIYEFVYKPKGIDVLWKAPWGLRELGALAPSAANSEVAWLDHYEGGWQEILPSGGGPCVYNGIAYAFHGEVSTAPWDYQIVQPGGDVASVQFRIRTTRTPFLLERTMQIEGGRPVVTFRERLVNEGAVPMAYMWGHHPAYGAPFLGEACRLDIPARRFVNHPVQVFPERSWLPDGGSSPWPLVTGRTGQIIDMRRIPGPEARVNNLGYPTDLEEGWYALTNTALGFGVGLVWPKEAFPHIWLWQELCGSEVYPWWGRAYVMGVEIWTSYPGTGLADTVANGSARTLPPGGTTTVEVRALFYESQTGVRRSHPDGTISIAE